MLNMRHGNMMTLALLAFLGCIVGETVALGGPTYPSTSPGFKIKRTRPRPRRQGLELVPTFHSCSYYWAGAERKGMTVEFRPQGEGAWRRGYDPVRVDCEGMYRGSLVNLSPDTVYEVRLRDAAGCVASGTVRTWSPRIPIARTIVLDESNFKGTLRCTLQGTAEGWIRYVAAPGFIMSNDHQASLIKLQGASYVQMEGLTLNGGGHHAVEVTDSHHIRIVNCDISGWGTVGRQRFDRDGKFYHLTPDAKGRYRAVNYSSGIALIRGHDLVVERCYLHDPRNTANSWLYSHPAGPCGIYVVNPTSTVIRYNDLVGSDVHRWNDAVEGQYNFYEDGGFNRDADIYGNFFIFCNDDNVEIDGGQQNVRCFRNRFEASFCGLSIQGNMAGPSYVFDNMFLNMCDEFGNVGQFIKTSTPGSGLSAQSLIFNNSFFGGGTGIAMNKLLKIIALNNILSGSTICRRQNMKASHSVADYNLNVGRDTVEPHGLHADPAYVDAQRGQLRLQKTSPARGRGCEIPNFTGSSPVDMGAYHRPSSGDLPERPIPLSLDVGKLNFQVGATAVKPQKVTLSVGGSGFAGFYQVEVTRAVAPWLKVTPGSGRLSSGDRIVFTVSVDAAHMTQRAFYRGAFLIRLASGYSRPVSVYAETLYNQPVHLAGKDDVAVYVDLSQPDGESNLKQFHAPFAEGRRAVKLHKRERPYCYGFEVPVDGQYAIMLRARHSGGSYRVMAGIDDETMGEAALSLQRIRWGYYILSPGGGWFRKVKIYALKKGRHTLKLNPIDFMELDVAVVTDNPKAFEPR